MTTNNGLYVHIPFCNALCHYCDFPKLLYNKQYIQPFLRRLTKDLRFFNVPHNLTTIYVGGGTPTSLATAELKALLDLLAPFTKLVREYTFEANVESLSSEKLHLLKDYGVNRLSIGVQTTCDKMLVYLNRKHTYADVIAKITEVKAAGFANFSVDLMYGLPGQTLEDLQNDVTEILKLDAPHVSLYALTIEANTVAGINKWPEVSEELNREMYVYIVETLRKAHYERYEISNFAKQGFASMHNKLYWQNNHYYAIGYGASGYIENERYVLRGSFSAYLNNKLVPTRETITKEANIEEYLMLNLRLADGFARADFLKRYGIDFVELYAAPLVNLRAQKLLEITTERVFATDEGLLLLDHILFKLL